LLFFTHFTMRRMSFLHLFKLNSSCSHADGRFILTGGGVLLL